MGDRVERLVQQCLVTGQLVGAEEAEVDHAVLVVEDLLNLSVVSEAEAEAEAGAEEEEEEEEEEGEDDFGDDFEDDFEDGFEDGFEDNFEDGFEDGFEDYFEDGFEDGFEDNFEDDFEVAQVVEAVEGEGGEEVDSAGVEPGFALVEQHVVGLVEPRVEDHCDRGEAPAQEAPAQEAVLVAEVDWGGHWRGHWRGYDRPDCGLGLRLELEGSDGY